MSVQFDTLKAVKALREAGFDNSQAEAVVETVGAAMTGNLASRSDLTEFQTEVGAALNAFRGEVSTDLSQVQAQVTADMDGLRTELKTEIADVRTELKTEIGAVRTELTAEIADVRNEPKIEIGAISTGMAEQFRDLHKQLWIMGFGIVGLTVTLIKLL